LRPLRARFRRGYPSKQSFYGASVPGLEHTLSPRGVCSRIPHPDAIVAPPHGQFAAHVFALYIIPQQKPIVSTSVNLASSSESAHTSIIPQQKIIVSTSVYLSSPSARTHTSIIPQQKIVVQAYIKSSRHPGEPMRSPAHLPSRMGRHHHSLSRYHSTVLRMPDSKSSRGRHPSSVSSLAGSMA